MSDSKSESKPESNSGSTPDTWTPKTTILDAKQLGRIIRRMAGEIVEQDGIENLLLVGIRTRGVPLAERLAQTIRESEDTEVMLGELDITLYRDDLSAIGPYPEVRESRLPGMIDGKVLVLCDDVLFTGRTVRAALDALQDYGRPKAVRLAVLIDRGHRELPIQADTVGKVVPTRRTEHVEVRFKVVDGVDQVRILERSPAADEKPVARA